MSNRIYLDNAATSWPKPEAVYAAVDAYQRDNGAPAGRGQSHEASEVGRQIERLRSRLANFIGAPDPRNVVFTFNGTDSLNQAICGILRPGDHVVATATEHNSTLRPLRYLAQQGGATVTIVPCDRAGVVDARDIEGATRPETALIALSHASNVTGVVQEADLIGKIAQECGAYYLLDAAQSLGRVPIDVKTIKCDLLAAPGHKGLLGPLGTGVLYVSDSVANSLVPIRMGGTGTVSDQDTQPDTLPDKFESGNHNVPGLLGLSAGLDYVIEQTVQKIAEHERRLTTQLIDGLTTIDGIEIFGASAEQGRVGVISFNLRDIDARELATMLETSCGVQGRAGIHCAPLIHAALGTAERGGTMRLSVGPFNTPEQIDATIQGLCDAATAMLDF